MVAENRKALKHNGLCLWLTADVSTIIARMRSDKASTAQRPPLSDDGLEEETAAILAAREPFYQEMTDCIVDTAGKGIDAVVDEVCSELAHYDIVCNERRSPAT